MTEKIRKIKTWMNKGGFPFEMKVAKAFKESGFKIGQSIMFKDSETDKYRETDIIAHVSKEFEKVWFNLTFVIECKKTTDKPWIILKTDSKHQILKDNLPIIGSNNSKFLTSKIIQSDKFYSPLIFPDLTNYGYNIITAFSQNKDSAYSATQSVLKATDYLVKKSNEMNNRFCNIYIPIIAIEGELYDGKLNNTNELELQEVNVSTVVSTKSFEEQNIRILNIVTSKYLNEFSKKIKKECNIFYEKYEKELKETAKTKPTNLKRSIYDNPFS